MEGDGARGNARGGESISIHALRVEGDRPSMYDKYKYLCISIHALRVEGDFCPVFGYIGTTDISIHALRVEGDKARLNTPATTT